MERQRHKGTRGRGGEEDRWGPAESEHPLPLRKARDGESDGNRKGKVEDTVLSFDFHPRQVGDQPGFYPSGIRKLEDR